MALNDDDEDAAAGGGETRGPMPPGDPLAWAVLVAGTSLDGTPWPGWGRSGWDAPVQGGLA